MNIVTVIVFSIGYELIFFIISGFTEICIMHPLDVVKTRFQIQTKGVTGDPNYYTSVYDCMRKMARNEGILSLYKGVIPPVLVETPKRAVKVNICIYMFYLLYI